MSPSTNRRATSIARADVAARVVLIACLAVVALWLLNGAPAAALRGATRAPLAETSDAAWVGFLASTRWAVTWAVLGSSVVAGALAGRVGALRRRLERDAWATPGATQAADGVLVAERAPLGLHPGVGGALLTDGATERDVVTSIVDLARRGHVRLEQDCVGSAVADVGRLRALTIRLTAGDDEPSDLERGILTALAAHGGAVSPARDAQVWNDVVAGGVDAIDRAAVAEGYYRLPRRAMVSRMRLAGSLIAAGALLIAALFAMNGLSVLWAAPVTVAGLVVAELGRVVPVLTLAGATTVHQLEAHRAHLLRNSAADAADDLREGRAASSLTWANAYAIAVPATEVDGPLGRGEVAGVRRGHDWLALWPAWALTGTESIEDAVNGIGRGAAEEIRFGSVLRGLSVLA
ncbi:DUF2207 family protein [Actinomyces radicidentis]|uniref:DUF2207 family protein n=1 Tax=Actinomyces radicidentis TaxID=111015 RepID=UPI0028EECA9E|nr:DUF2207 domain-containing protein [Actinomyces radicidentis]